MVTRRVTKSRSSVQTLSVFLARVELSVTAWTESRSVRSATFQSEPSLEIPTSETYRTRSNELHRALLGSVPRPTAGDTEMIVSFETSSGSQTPVLGRDIGAIPATSSLTTSETATRG